MSLVCEREGCTIEEQIAMFLRVVGHNQTFRVVHQSSRRSIETVHRHFHQVLYVVGELMNEMIKPPSTAIHPKVLESHRWNPYFMVIVKHMFPAFGRCTYSHVLSSHLHGF
jgi:predicted chitinase